MHFHHCVKLFGIILHTNIFVLFTFLFLVLVVWVFLICIKLLSCPSRALSFNRFTFCLQSSVNYNRRLVLQVKGINEFNPLNSRLCCFAYRLRSSIDKQILRMTRTAHIVRFINCLTDGVHVLVCAPSLFLDVLNAKNWPFMNKLVIDLYRSFLFISNNKWPCQPVATKIWIKTVPHALQSDLKYRTKKWD